MYIVVHSSAPHSQLQRRGLRLEPRFRKCLRPVHELLDRFSIRSINPIESMRIAGVDLVLDFDSCRIQFGQEDFTVELFQSVLIAVQNQYRA